MKTEPERTYSIELTENEIWTLDGGIQNLSDSISEFGANEIDILNQMAVAYIQSNPSQLGKVIHVIGMINSTFLNLANHKTHLFTVSLKAEKIAETI